MATLLRDLEDQETKLMKCANTCQFLFDDDKIICETVKNLYKKFSKYASSFTKQIIDELNNNGFKKYIKNKNLNLDELFYSDIFEVIKLAKEYNKSNSFETIELAKEIEDIFIF